MQFIKRKLTSDCFGLRDTFKKDLLKQLPQNSDAICSKKTDVHALYQIYYDNTFNALSLSDMFNALSSKGHGLVAIIILN